MLPKSFLIKYGYLIPIVNSLYSGEQRLWHNINHINEMTTKYMSLVDLKHISYNESDILAILFHDAIYNPKSTSNEEDSACLAEDLLKNTDADIKFIKEAIHATKLHMLSEDTRVNIILDLDLMVLGANPIAYIEYCEKVRLEYKHIADPDWTIGRTALLQSIFSNNIFKTLHFKDLEPQAKSNIRNELLRLASVSNS